MQPGRVQTNLALGPTLAAEVNFPHTYADIVRAGTPSQRGGNVIFGSVLPILGLDFVRYGSMCSMDTRP